MGFGERDPRKLTEAGFWKEHMSEETGTSEKRHPGKLRNVSKVAEGPASGRVRATGRRVW